MKNYRLNKTVFFCISFLMAACSLPIQGTITQAVGNLMPSPDASTPKGKLLQTTIAFCEPLIYNGENPSDGLYANLPTKLVKETSSNTKGFYNVQLDEGKYSVFVKIKEGWYAREVTDTYVNLLVVEKGKKIVKNIDVKFNTTQ